MKNQLNWDDLRYFLHVARTNNLTQSALELKVSQSTIARRISGLEKDIKITLFTRHQTGYFLTDQAKGIFQYALAVEAKIMGFESAVDSVKDDVAGTVKLATAENMAIEVIIPALPKLYQKYPNLRLEIVTSPNTVGFLKHEVDIALRSVRPEQDNLLVRRVGKMSYSLFAHTKYLANFKKPYIKHIDQYQFITWDSVYSHLPSARWLAKHIPNAQSILAITSIATQLASVKAGLGIAVLPNLLTAHDKKLIAIKEDVFADDLWIVSYAELRSSKNIRAVIDFIVQELNEFKLIDSL